MKRKDLARRATSAALAACMMFTLSAPALAESTDALMQLSIGSYRSSSLLSEENSVTLPDITVGSTKVTEDNYQNILGDNTLSYDTKTNTLKSDGTIHRDLTIDAPGVNIELCNTSSNPVVFAKLTVTNAKDVKVTSPYGLAVFGAVEISCTGEVEITSEESYAVTGNVTVKQASKVAISGKSNTDHIVTGDVTIACLVPVTIRNNSTGGMANSIVYSGGKYVYSDTEGGKPVDPSSTPINASANAVYITPAVAHALTVKNGTSKVGGADASTAYADQTVTVTPNDRTAEGYQFVRWEVVSGITDAELNRSTTDNTATFTMPDKDVELKARYNKLHTITVEKGTASLPQAIQGTEVIITAATIPGRKFDHWVVKSGGVTLTDPKSDMTTFKMLDEGNVTVEAKYKAIQPITVNQGTYTVNGTAATEAVKGDKIVATAQDAPAGKKFAGWTAKGINLTDEQKKSPVVEFEMPKNGVELTAQYKTLHTITVTNGKADKAEAIEGETVTITPDNRLSDKLKFGRWEVRSGKVTLSGIKTATFTMPDEPVELEAVYNNLYTATVNDGTNTTTTNAVAGTEVTVTANVPDGEKFTGWKVENNTALSLNDKSIDLTQREITFNMPSTDITLTAEHKTIRTLTVVGGTIDGSSSKSIQAIAGDTITVHSALAPNQQFLHWTSDDIRLTGSQSKSDPLTITMPDSNVTITAVPKQLYTVTVRNGTVRDKSEATVNPGETVTIKADNKTALGEVFVGWTVTSLDANGNPNVKLDNPTAESTTFTMIGANVEVEAKYEKQHTVTVLYQTEAGTTEDTSQKKTAIFGEDIKVKAEDKPAEGLIFDHWEVKVGDDTVTDLLADYENDDPPAFKMRRDNVTLTAVYKKLYTIKVTNSVNNDVYEAGKTKKDGTVPLAAALISGYRFKNWKVLDGNADVSDAGILTLKGDGDVLVRAEYVKLYNLTVNFGTAVNKTVETETTTDGDGRIVLPAADGDSITATANGTTPDQIFTGWTVEGGDIGLTEEQLKDNKSITFTMPDSAVTLTATYSYVHDQTVTVVNGTAHTGDTPAAEAITVTPGETVYIEPADRWEENLIFTEWEVTSGKGVELKYAEDGTVSFIMPQSDEIVEITAQYAKLHAVTINDGDVIDADGHGINNMNDGQPGAIAGTNITIKAKDKSDEGKVFDQWIITGDNVTLIPVNDDGSVATFEMPTFEMPDEAVVITAVYKNVHTVTVHSEDSTNIFENIKEGTAYKVTAPEISGMRFSHWVVNFGDVTDLVTDLAERTGTFTMPDGNVDLTAEYVKLYGLTVTYGTAADAHGHPAPSAAAGDRITVNADEPYPTETFEGWKLLEGTITEITDKKGNVLNVRVNEDGYLVDENGEKILNTPFTFTMPDGNVELKADYSMPAYVMEQRVIVEGGTAFAEGEAAAAEISADPGKRITVSADPNADPNMIFDYWEVTSLDEDGKATVKLEDATSMTTSFTMPMAPVKLTARWRTIDEAPSSSGGGAGAAIAGVAIGGAAVWGGYEIATRVILNDLLPAGAAIPANRGQLALLIWTEKGKPEPAAQPAFADITDAELAKAAQWCVEQGLLDAREGKFEPDGWMPKFKTIEIWNRAFPKK